MRNLSLCLSLCGALASISSCASAPNPREAAAPAGEAKAIARVTQVIADGVKKGFQENAIARRDAHAKHHGCVHATFTIDEQLASEHPELAVGLFAKARSYPAWIRLSNGAGKVGDDRKGDARGMAIKIMDVTGEKLLSDEAKTQDLLLINHPVFFVRNAADYVEFIEAVAKGSPRAFFIGLRNPFTWRIHEALIGRAIQKRKVTNPLAIRYWSMVPVKLGEKAIKYSARPCAGQTFLTPPAGPDQLRGAMSLQLGTSQRDVCFDFLVQTQTDARAMPIEDPTIEWSERKSPFKKVATITIAPQAFESAEQMDFCENLSFTPWHALPEHEPLGGIQRARKTVYQTISTLRHELNGKKQAEPEP